MKYFCAIFLLVGALCISVSASAEHVVVVTSDDNPFGPGIERVLRQAYAALGHSLAVKRLPTARSIEESNTGRYDGELARVSGITSRYPNLIMVDVPIARLDIVAVTKRRDLKIRKWSDLSGLSVCYPAGALLIERKLPADVLHDAVLQDLEHAFALMDNGRADVVVSSRPHIEWTMRSINRDGYLLHEPPLERVVLYHYLHKKNRALARNLESVLIKMKQQGRIKRILEKR